MRGPVTQGMLHADDNSQAQALYSNMHLNEVFTVVTLQEGKLLGSKGQAALVVRPGLMLSLFEPCFMMDSSRLHKSENALALRSPSKPEN